MRPDRIEFWKETSKISWHTIFSLVFCALSCKLKIHFCPYGFPGQITCILVILEKKPFVIIFFSRFLDSLPLPLKNTFFRRQPVQPQQQQQQQQRHYREKRADEDEANETTVASTDSDSTVHCNWKIKVRGEDFFFCCQICIMLVSPQGDWGYTFEGYKEKKKSPAPGRNRTHDLKSFAPTRTHDLQIRI